MLTKGKNDSKTVNAWVTFDWANSAFALVITTAIFPVYYLQSTNEVIRILGMDISNSTLYAYAISTTYLLLALFSPLLSGMADYSGSKKKYLKRFTYLGAIACLMLFFFTGVSATNTLAQNNFQTALGTLGFMFSMLGFAGGLVFYNAYLPEIVTEDRYDSVSAKGFAYGFLGSVILLIINLIMIQKPTWFGLPDEGTLVVRLSFVIVGLWWLGFAQIPFRLLPDDDTVVPVKVNFLKKGLQQLQGVWYEIKEQANTRIFLLSFFFFNAGVQAMLYLAGTFAEKELSFEASELILLIILLQFLAIVGAYLFAK
ncbi:MAG: MFS transporter, partial [Bacteroidota bacterium]